MTTVQEDHNTSSSIQSTISKQEIVQAQLSAQQAVRNLSPGNSSSSVPFASLRPVRQSSPNPSQMSNSSAGHMPYVSQQQLYQQQRLVQQHLQQQQELGIVNSNNVLVNGTFTPRSRLLTGSPTPALPVNGITNHFRNKSSPSSSLNLPVGAQHPLNGLHAAPSPVQSHPHIPTPLSTHAVNSSAYLQQQILNNELYMAGGIRRSDSNSSITMMNGLQRRSSETSRNGHSAKMVHSYANGKNSPVGMRPGTVATRPPVYPNGNSIHPMVNGGNIHALSQGGVPPTLRSIASLNGSMQGSLSARGVHHRSCGGSINLSLEDGDDGSVGYPGGGLVRHQRNNSHPHQMDSVMVALQQQQLQQKLQQQQQQQQQQQLLRAGSGVIDTNQLQQQQLLAAIKQELMLQNTSKSASTADVYNQLLLSESEALGLDPALLSAAGVSQLNVTSLNHNIQTQATGALPAQQALQHGIAVPPKLELCTQLLGGDDVANQNLAAIPEFEQQIFSVVADLLHVIMLGESVQEVLTSIRAIVQYTRNEQSSLHTPMPQAFASWLRRLALIMPLISAVYQAKEHIRTVREGFTTLIRMFAEPYPVLGGQLESLMGMGEAAAACMLDATNLWRQVVALLSDKEAKLKQMECQPLHQDSYEGRYTRASTGSDNSATQLGVEACHRLMDSVSDFQECEGLVGKQGWGDILKS